MNDLREAFDGDGSEDELVEIDWAPLLAAIDAMAEEGLDLDDGEDLINHWAALLGVLLRKVRGDEQLSEDELLLIVATFLDAFPRSALFRGDFFGRHPIGFLLGRQDL